MGQPINSRVLTLKELRKYGELIREKYHESLLQKFDGITPQASPDLIQKGGIELETTIVDQESRLAPLFEKLKRQCPDISPELLQCHAEVKTDEKNLFTPFTSLEDLTKDIYNLVSPLVTAVQSHRANIVSIGGHPMFEPKKAETMITNETRYQAFLDFAEPFAGETKIPFVDGTYASKKGAIWAGQGTSLQVTLKTAIEIVGFINDAYSLIAPLLLTASASSPLVEGRATMYDSTRLWLYPAAAYGFPEEDFRKGRPGRWRFLEPLSSNQELSEWADRKLYHLLNEKGINPSICHYLAEISGDGHFLISENQLDGSNKQFPKPSSWPFAQFAPSILDNKGIGIELRAGEIMPTPRENAAFVKTLMAMVQGVAEEMYLGKLSPLSAAYVNRNLQECSLGKPNQEKEIYWLDGINPSLRKLPDVFEYLGKLAVNVLHRYEHPDQEIKEILNPIIATSGVYYWGKNQFERMAPIPNPAQRMREIAYRVQPNTKKGKQIRPETLQAMLDPLIYKN